jgi:hypothetical protein
MKEDVKAKWVEALRSGRFEQGRRALRKMDDTYCCLGVLCELAVEAGVIAPATVASQFGEPYGYLYAEETAGLPQAVQEWSGLHSSLGYLPEGFSNSSNLAAVNDSGNGFEVIADIIEEAL